MAERSFVEEVKKLRLRQGRFLCGEGILAATKALLESGVWYAAVYQGAPIPHLMDVLADAQDMGTEPAALRAFQSPVVDTGNHAFEVELARSGQTFEAPAGQSILDCLIEHGGEPMSSPASAANSACA